MATMHKTEKELRQILSVKPDKDEGRQEFLARMIEASSKLGEDEWEGLSETQQDWINGAVLANKAGKKLPEFEPKAVKAALALQEGGDDGADADDGDADEADATKKPKGSKSAKSSKDDDDDFDKAAPKAKKPAKEVSEEKELTAMMFIRQYLIKHQDAGIEEIAKAAEKAGYKRPTNVTISTIRSEFRSLTKLYNKAGAFKTDFTLGDFVS